MEKISIGIVTYNSKANILDCIESIQKHSQGFIYQIYICDNASTDNTVELIENSFPNVKIISNNENQGYSTGHNKIIQQVDSTYHLIVNPDILFKSNVLKELIEIIEKNPDIALIAPIILNSDGTEQHLPKRDPKLLYLLSGRILLKYIRMRKFRDAYTMANEILSPIQEVEVLTGCFMLFQTNLLKQVNGFDDRYFMYFEDLDLSKRISKLGKVIFYSNTSVLHRWERGSYKNNKLLFSYIHSMFIYFSKKFFGKL